MQIDPSYTTLTTPEPLQDLAAAMSGASAADSCQQHIGQAILDGCAEDDRVQLVSSNDIARLVLSPCYCGVIERMETRSHRINNPTCDMKYLI